MIKVVGLGCSRTAAYQEPGSSQVWTWWPPRNGNKKGLGPPLRPSEAARITTSSSLFSVKCIRSTPEYFAERLFKAMKVRGGVDVNEVGGWGLCKPPQDCRVSGKSLGSTGQRECSRCWPQDSVMALCPRWAPEPGVLPGHTPAHPVPALSSWLIRGCNDSLHAIQLASWVGSPCFILFIYFF